MLDTESAQFITAVSFAVTAILLVVFSYAIHVLVSNRRLTEAQKKLSAMTVNLSSAEERERKRIADDLHDRIGETLIASNQTIEKLRRKWASTEANADLDELSQTIQTFIKGTRSLIFELIPPALYDLGLEAGIDSLVERCNKQYPLKIRVESDGQRKPVETDVAVFLYKAIRELVLNVIKHAGADTVTIKLSKIENMFRVEVEDNGSGFNSVHSVRKTDPAGYGLFNIHIQAEHYGGKLEIDTSHANGGRVKVVVPLTEDDNHGH